MSNNRTLQFVCSKCNGGVFRLGKKVDQNNKLCGKCNTQKGVNTGPQLPSEQDLIESDIKLPVTQLGSVFVAAREVTDRVNHYRARLDKVLELAKINPQETFYSLWIMTGITE